MGPSHSSWREVWLDWGEVMVLLVALVLFWRWDTSGDLTLGLLLQLLLLGKVLSRLRCLFILKSRVPFSSTSMSMDWKVGNMPNISSCQKFPTGILSPFGFCHVRDRLFMSHPLHSQLNGTEWKGCSFINISETCHANALLYYQQSGILTQLLEHRHLVPFKMPHNIQDICSRLGVQCGTSRKPMFL